MVQLPFPEQFMEQLSPGQLIEASPSMEEMTEQPPPVQEIETLPVPVRMNSHFPASHWKLASPDPL
jgi:hypothetical protein